MVWHAHMLNPRAFLEDCMRLGKMSLWAGGLPWEIVNACMVETTLGFSPGETARTNFEHRTRRPWDNLSDSTDKVLNCPKCHAEVRIPWSADLTQVGSLANPFGDCRAYADKHFRFPCPLCYLAITHDKLRVAKFRRDVQSLLKDALPMPGTLLSLRGVPENAESKRHPTYFPNRFIKSCISQQLLDLTDFSRNEYASVEKIREFFQAALKDSSLIRRADKTKLSGLSKTERISIRKMMSRYWENSSPFALDLVGAVVRQGTFVVKMDDIDWIHSPALDSTMERLIQKYGVFFRIICDNPTRVAVPTLDVDLAWHTHQLSPAWYYSYSYEQTKGRFIDHD